MKFHMTPFHKWNPIVTVIVVLVVMATGSLFAVEFTTAKSKVSADCTMNGFGQGECSFTNTGFFSSSVCGRIEVYSKLTHSTVRSSLFCSGSVGGNSTTEVKFSVVDVPKACNPPPKSYQEILDGYNETGKFPTNPPWSEFCSFTFTQK